MTEFTLKDSLLDELDYRDEKFENILSMYPKDIDMKQSIDRSGNFVVWTEHYIYYVAGDDRSSTIMSLPRNPQDNNPF